MSPASPPAPSAGHQPLDVRTLSLAQLHKLAAQGSRRARAELESRLSASADAPANPPARPAPPPLPPAAAMSPLPARAAQPRMAASAPAVRAPAAPDAGAPHLQRADQLELIARQDEQRSRADGPPRLVGLVLIAWGALFLLGALVMLSKAASMNGLYYAYCAVGAAAVGWLLMRCNRWAMPLHGALLLVALGWAWYSAGGIGMALLQAIPLLIPAAWIAVPSIREPLE